MRRHGSIGVSEEACTEARTLIPGSRFQPTPPSLLETGCPLGEP